MSDAFCQDMKLQKLLAHVPTILPTTTVPSRCLKTVRSWNSQALLAGLLEFHLTTSFSSSLKEFVNFRQLCYASYYALVSKL